MILALFALIGAIIGLLAYTPTLDKPKEKTETRVIVC